AVHALEEWQDAKIQSNAVGPDPVLHPRCDLAFEKNQIRDRQQHDDVHRDGDEHPGGNMQAEPIYHLSRSAVNLARPALERIASAVAQIAQALLAPAPIAWWRAAPS